MAFDRYNRFLKRMQNQGKTIPGFNYVRPHVSNFFTGLEMKNNVSKSLMAGIVAWGVGSVIVNAVIDNEIGYTKKQLTNNAEDVGFLPGMSGDAVGNSYYGRKDLGAVGDLVFGLHNARRRR